MTKISRHYSIIQLFSCFFSISMEELFANSIYINFFIYILLKFSPTYMHAKSN